MLRLLGSGLGTAVPSLAKPVAKAPLAAFAGELSLRIATTTYLRDSQRASSYGMTRLWGMNVPSRGLKK